MAMRPMPGGARTGCACAHAACQPAPAALRGAAAPLGAARPRLPAWPAAAGFAAQPAPTGFSAALTRGWDAPGGRARPLCRSTADAEASRSVEVAEYTRATLEAAQQSVEAQRTAEVGDARNGGGGSGSGWDCGQQWQRHAAAAPPAASLTRAVYSMQPARIARTAAGSGGRAGPGLPVPTSLLVLAVTVGAAAVAAVRARMRSIRECGACRGYGVKRCRLCSGRGSIEWEGKMAHREPCPLCLGRRFNPCTCCGGGPFLARNLFTHKNSGSEAGLVAQLASLTESASLRQRRAWPLGLGRLRPRGGGADNDERIENSDKLAEQIMMD